MIAFRKRCVLSAAVLCGGVSCTIDASRQGQAFYPVDSSQPRENRAVREMVNGKMEDESSQYGFVLFAATKNPLRAELVDVRRTATGSGSGRERVISGDVKVAYDWKYGILKLPFLPPLISWTGDERSVLEPFRLAFPYERGEGKEVPFSAKFEGLIRQVGSPSE